MSKRYLITEGSFLRGAYRYPGEQIELEDNEVSGNETNLKAMDGDVPAMPAVQIAPISVTGPNPTAPQQIPPDARQTMAGYVIPGQARLVSEVTASEEVRTAELADANDTSQADLLEQLRAAQEENARLRAEAQSRAAVAGSDAPMVAGGDVNSTANVTNDDDALVDGTVAEITASLGEKSDEELAALRAAELDRQKPRKGVLTALDEEENRRLNA